MSEQDVEVAYKAAILDYRRANSIIEEDKNLNESQKNQLLALLERGILKPAAFVDQPSSKLKDMLVRHGRLVKNCALAETVEEDKPTYLCTMMNIQNGFTLLNRDILVNADYHGAELQMSYSDALQLGLCPFPHQTMWAGVRKDVLLTRMLPPVRVKLPLRDATGHVRELSEVLDVYVKQDEIEEGEVEGNEITASDSTTSDSNAKGKRAAVTATIAPESKRQRTDEVPHINSLVPAKFVLTGSATLGRGGAAKLGVRFDPDSKELVLLPPKPRPFIGTQLTRIGGPYTLKAKK